MTDYLLVMAMMAVALIAVFIAFTFDGREPDVGDDADAAHSPQAATNSASHETGASEPADDTKTNAPDPSG